MKIAMFYNVEGWAWWYKTHQIKKHIDGNIKIHIVKLGSPVDPEDFDFIVTFNPSLLPVKFVPSYKLIAGSSCPIFLGELLEYIDTGKCLTGFVNSLEMYTASGKLQDQVYCCQNGVDTDLFTPSGNPVEPITACWVGDSTSIGNKGLDLIKAACAKVETRLLYIDRQAGKDPAGVLSHQEIRDQVYYRSSFYICASEFEATPNPALEALACGLPVISTKVGNMPEIIRDGYNGFLVDRSVEGIAEAIEKIKDADLAEMGKNARQSILNGWTWKQQVKKYEHMFLELYRKQQTLKAGNAINETISAEGLLQLAGSYIRHGDYPKAGQKLDQLLERKEASDLQRSDAHYLLGNILESRDKSRWRDHLEESNRLLIPLENKSDVQLYRAASVFKRLGRLDRSVEWFQKVLECSGSKEILSGVLFHLGEIYYKKNNFKESRDHFEKCLEMNPGHQAAQKFLKRL